MAWSGKLLCHLVILAWIGKLLCHLVIWMPESRCYTA